MKCPNCADAMEKTVRDDIAIDRCCRCSGIWVNRASFAGLLQKTESDLSIAESFEAMLDTDAEESMRHCPACNNRRLLACYIEDTELDFCTRCKGLFFDEGELESVFGIEDEIREADQCNPKDSVLWAIIRGLGFDK